MGDDLSGEQAMGSYSGVKQRNRMMKGCTLAQAFTRNGYGWSN